MSTLSSGNLTSGFVDLASYDEIERYMYGQKDATAYFVRDVRKATWFTQVPVCLSKSAGSPAFGQEWSVSISRAGDYLLQTWLRLTLPDVTPVQGRAVRWTRNFMHNLIKECSITFNDLVAARFDNYHLDFWSAFTVPAGKRNAYDNMIGNIDDLTVDSISQIKGRVLNLPLPFFFTRDSGVALPTAALPYNEMKINFSFRDWEELLIISDPTAEGEQRVATAATELTSSAPVLSNVQVWANYAIVSNQERKRMGCAPRDILVEQVQTIPRQAFTPATNPVQSFDIRLSHAIKVLFFGVRNSTWKSEWSNYTTHSPSYVGGNFTMTPEGSSDPILQTSLIYENTNRLAQMGSDYFSLVNPFYHAPVVPAETGYHSYSYSLDFYCLDPMGSTNYGKLTNVSIVPEASQAATETAGDGQTFHFILTAVNNNVIRVSGGALGFPVL